MLHVAPVVVGRAGLDPLAPIYTQETYCHPTRTLGNKSLTGWLRQEGALPCGRK